MKTIIAAVALSSSLAMAQSYSQAVAKQSRCQGIGDLWAESWEHDTVLGKKLKQYSKDHQGGKIDQDTMNFVMMIFIYSPHREKFRSAHDAYMAGWAECMDGRQEAMSKNEMIMLPREVVEHVMYHLNRGDDDAVCWADGVIKPALEQPKVTSPQPKPEWAKTKSTWVVDHLRHATFFDADQIGEMIDFAAASAAAPQPPEHYDQRALDLCLTCGWKTMIPGDCCLNCARQKPLSS